MTNEKTVGSVIETMTETQKKALYYHVGCAIEGVPPTNLVLMEQIYTMNDDQTTVLFYLVNEARKNYSLEIV